MRLSHYWKSSFNLGTAGVSSNTLLRSIQLVNGLTLFGLLSTWVALLMIGLSGAWAGLPVNLISQGAMGVVLWLNFKGHHGKAAALLVVLMQLAVVGQALTLGAATGVYLWLLPIIVIPHLLVIGPRENVWLACHSLLSVVLFCFFVLRLRDSAELSNDQAFALVSVAWAFFGMGYYGRKLNDAWANKERLALEEEQRSAKAAEKQKDLLEKAIEGKIETEQILVEQLFKVSGLNEFSEKLAEATSEADVLELAARQARRISGAQGLELFLQQEHRGQPKWLRLAGREFQEVDEVWTWEGSFLQQVAQGSSSVVSNDCANEEAEHWKAFADQGFGSAMILPMQAGADPIGVAVVGAQVSGHFDRMSTPVVQQFVGVLCTHLELRRTLRKLEVSLDKSDNLLVNVLPAPIADRMKQGEVQIADRIDEAAILFCDLVGFTAFSATATPEQVVALLQEIFGVLEDECERHGVEKIKTIGDAFMAAAGITVPVNDPAEAMARFADSASRQLRLLMEEHSTQIGFRMGMHLGPVVAGVIGGHRLFYDVWGDTVNLASRVESSGRVGAVSCTDSVRQALHSRWRFTDRGLVSLKGKGDQRIWLLEGPQEGMEKA